MRLLGIDSKDKRTKSYKYILFSIILFYCTILHGQITFTPNDNFNYFSIHYADSTPDYVKTIITQTTQKLSKYIKSTIPINVQVNWIAQKDNVEASCSPNEMVSNFPNCPYKNTLFPISLAEKIAKQELNNSKEADIIMKINKNMSWYYGIDGNPDSNKVDLYTILLHELCHGIGFQSNFSVENSSGLLSGTGLPFVYDIFLIDSVKDCLLNTTKYPNNSSSLYNALTSDSIYFLGKFVHIKNANGNAKIYAPKTFNSGSSISHLDYPQNSENSLLNYAKKYGEAIHEIGPICEGILADIGWNDFLISSNQLKDNEDIKQKSEVLVYLDSIFDPATLLLHYSYDKFTNELTIPFSKTDTSNYYRAIIPTFPFEHTVGYYITVVDTTKKASAGIPNNFPSSYYSFRIGKDTIKPTINHTAITDISEDMDTLSINTRVTDNVGVDSVWVEYLINSLDTLKSKKIRLTNTSFDNFETKILLKGLIKETDIFRYRICAVDKSTNKNIVKTFGSGEYGFYQITVGSKSLPFISLDENFENQSLSEERFALDGFSIAQPDGFSSKALHSTHPYPTAKYSGKTINLTATLKNTVTIRDQEAYMEFDEIALLEPSEFGTVYGDYEFWDYCIIEGSKDKINWYAFELKGYKTEMYADWLATFYTETTTDNNGKISSTAKGTESLYHNHKINLLGNKYLRKGDNVYIRFRLFSDAFQNGWGWAIDNLKIQTTQVENTITESTKNIIVYPTISNKTFTISADDNEIIKQVEVISTMGNLIPFDISQINKTQYSISIKGNSGMYFLKILLGDGEFKTVKLFLKSNE